MAGVCGFDTYKTHETPKDFEFFTQSAKFPDQGSLVLGLDGSNAEDLITGLGQVWDITLDVDGGKMYFAEGTVLKRANLDGSSVETIVSSLSFATGVSLDLVNDKVYWVDTDNQKVQRADLDGSNVEDIVTTGNPWGVAVDGSGGKVYWTDWSAGKIYRADLDGSNGEEMVTGAGDVEDIALDTSSGKMYWVRYWEAASGDNIHSANLDGTGETDLAAADYPRTVALALEESEEGGESSASTFLRLDRLKASAATGGTLCFTPATDDTEASVQVTFPAGFTVNGTAGNWTVDTDDLPSGGTAWPGIDTATAVSGQTVTFPSDDLSVGTLYCFNFSGTDTLTTSTAGSDKAGSITTRTSAPANIDSVDYATAVISEDQVTIEAIVPPHLLLLPLSYLRRLRL